MRLAGAALVIVAAWLSSVDAKPKQAKTPPAKGAPATPAAGAQGKQATPQPAGEPAKLDKELIDHQVKQSNYAALKIAKQLYELQKKISGEDSPDTTRRKQALASLYQQVNDYASAERLFNELLKSAEKLHGA